MTIEEAGSAELDDLFDRLDQRYIPAGYKVEIVEGTICMARQRGTHWETLADIYEQLRTRYPRKRVLSGVRIDFPGCVNGFASDVVALAESATKNDKGHPRYQDIELVAEVFSESTGKNDYGPKKTAYALAEVPVYMIADPCLGRCRVFTGPQDGEYKIDLTVAHGRPVDLTPTVAGITLSSEEFPRD
ncbi:Uma2 family endonuclease [Streptomyces decoyicus]|uniref:Uma2 family endonuclease n=1 Tax=Streptomyces decoyicus TaxID=249567 RepID=UPI002E176DF7|nr:Uma2 family endonuclease [Streptomyces decoyicus]